MLIDKGAHDDTVADNLIGILPSGASAPNRVGVFIEAGAFSNMIGPANVIANNANAIMLQPTLARPPVHTPQPTNFNRFTQNAIYDATNPLAIDLTPFGKANTTVGDPDANEGVRTPDDHGGRPHARRREDVRELRGRAVPVVARRRSRRSGQDVPRHGHRIVDGRGNVHLAERHVRPHGHGRHHHAEGQHERVLGRRLGALTSA